MPFRIRAGASVSLTSVSQLRLLDVLHTAESSSSDDFH